MSVLEELVSEACLEIRRETVKKMTAKLLRFSVQGVRSDEEIHELNQQIKEREKAQQQMSAQSFYVPNMSAQSFNVPNFLLLWTRSDMKRELEELEAQYQRVLDTAQKILEPEGE